jgi:hypothetical protein
MELAWMPIAKLAFEDLRKRAGEAGKHDEFAKAHNEIVLALRDFDTAFAKGELLFRTQKPGGEVRLWVNRVIAMRFIARSGPAGF